MAELHFLAAKLRMKIESLSLLSNKPLPKVSYEGRSDHSLSLAQDPLSSQLNLLVDQLTMQTHTLERENVELKATCQKCSNELLQLENKISALNKEIHDKTEEIGDMRQKYDQLSKDATTFESYLDSLQTDEYAVRIIVQKIHDAYQLTREELSKVTAQHKDALKSLKMYSDYYQTQRALISESQNRIVDLQSKLEKTSASNAQYLSKEGAYAEEKMGLQRHISRLESTIELLKQNQTFGSKVDSLLITMTQNTSSWIEKSTLISGELGNFREILAERIASNEAAQQKEIQDLMTLLQTREREYQHIFSDLGVTYPPRIPPSESHPNQGERNVGTPRSIQKEIINPEPRLPIPAGHLKRSGGSSPRNQSNLKQPKIQSSVSHNTKTVATTASSSCPLCHECPYGLMKICRNCGNQFHSACAKKVSNTSTNANFSYLKHSTDNSRSFQCSFCEK